MAAELCVGKLLVLVAASSRNDTGRQQQHNEGMPGARDCSFQPSTGCHS